MKGTMKLIDHYTSMMECRVCGSQHQGQYAGDGKFKRGAWQCRYGCSREDIKSSAK